MVKRCAKCKELKFFYKFSRSKDKKFGVSSYCRKCALENVRKPRGKVCTKCGKAHNHSHGSLCRPCYGKWYRSEFPEKVKNDVLNYVSIYIDQWRRFFMDEYKVRKPTCELCGREIEWIGAGRTKSVCWDHRHGSDSRIKSPNAWLRRPCTKENKDLWRKEDFGRLCQRCNQFLPTEDRDEWIQDLIKYNNKSRGD